MHPLLLIYSEAPKIVKGIVAVRPTEHPEAISHNQHGAVTPRYRRLPFRSVVSTPLLRFQVQLVDISRELCLLDHVSIEYVHGITMHHSVM